MEKPALGIVGSRICSESFAKGLGPRLTFPWVIMMVAMAPFIFNAAPVRSAPCVFTIETLVEELLVVGTI